MGLRQPLSAGGWSSSLLGVQYAIVSFPFLDKGGSGSDTDEVCTLSKDVYP